MDAASGVKKGDMGSDASVGLKPRTVVDWLDLMRMEQTREIARLDAVVATLLRESVKALRQLVDVAIRVLGRMDVGMCKDVRCQSAILFRA